MAMLLNATIDSEMDVIGVWDLEYDMEGWLSTCPDNVVLLKSKFNQTLNCLLFVKR